MEKMWAVSSGSYSSYEVCALFRSEAEAEKAADTAGRDGFNGCFVEEFDVYDEAPEPVVVHYMRAAVYESGATGDVVEFGRRFMPWDVDDTMSTRPEVEVMELVKVDAKRSAVVTAEGTDIQAVRQAFGDAKAQWLARVHGI